MVSRRQGEGPALDAGGSGRLGRVRGGHRRLGAKETALWLRGEPPPQTARRRQGHAAFPDPPPRQWRRDRRARPLAGLAPCRAAPRASTPVIQLLGPPRACGFSLERMGGFPPQSWEMGFDATRDFHMAPLLEDRPDRKAGAAASSCMSRAAARRHRPGQGRQAPRRAEHVPRAAPDCGAGMLLDRRLRHAALARHGRRMSRKPTIRELKRLAASCNRFSPWTAPDEPDGLWIEATGLAHLFGGEEALMRHILDYLRGLGFEARGRHGGNARRGLGAGAVRRSRPAVIVPPGEEALPSRPACRSKPCGSMRTAPRCSSRLGLEDHRPARQHPARQPPGAAGQGDHLPSRSGARAAGANRSRR